MNREQTIEAIKVMQAFVDGKEVECADVRNLQWGTTSNPAWKWYESTYRIKPTAKLRPWTADEVPLGAWMRFKTDETNRWLVANVGSESRREQWLSECEHSTDGGKTWLPCGVMEEDK